MRKNILGFVGLSAIAGVLATAAVTPALAITGMTANNSIGIFENLPEYLDIGDLAQKTNLYAMRGEERVLLASFYDQNRAEVSWDQVSQFAKDAAIAGEDPRFYEHGGIDIQGTFRAIVKTYAGGGETQGGSSITQQYVKNILVQKAEAIDDEEARAAAYYEAVETTPQRKLREMKMAIGVEKAHTKDSILLGYLNIALFGGRVYGIEAAANYYFNTNAVNLTLEQAASLLAIVNNPEHLRIDQPNNEVNGAADGYLENKNRRNYILDKMLDEKKITQEAHDAAIAQPVEPHITETSTGCQTAGGAAYFCDYVTKIFQNNESFGPDADARWANFKRGGFDVYTSLDLELQQAAEDTINANVPKSFEDMDLGAVAVSVQPGTGRVLAMAQNKDYSQDPDILAQGDNWTSVNYNTDFEYGGSTGFQPGSTYKTFTLAEWLAAGHSLNETVDGTRKASWGVFQDSCNGLQNPPGPGPLNDEGGNGGTYSALQSTIGSINTGFVGMARKLDLCGIRKMAQSFGVHRADGDPLDQRPATVLGTNEIAPLTMAAAFAGMAANGVVCAPIAIDRIVGRDGADHPVPSADCEQKVEPDVTANMTYAMQQVMTSGTGVSSNLRDGIPHFGKTGTTDNNEATWMSGGTTKVATVVGVFNVNGHTDLRKTSLTKGQAAMARHRMWPAIMAVADAKYGGDAFPNPTGVSAKPTTVHIPDVLGKSLDEAKSTLEKAGFAVQHAGEEDSERPQGVVSSMDPQGTATRGATITIYTSNGALKILPDAISGSETFEDARKKLQTVGFTNVICQESGGQDRKPTAQNPAPGTVAPPTTQVIITAGRC